MQFREEKFRELMLYVAEKSDTQSGFGATVLNKVLFYSDFLAYGRLGDSITGATYQKLNHGPAPRELLPVRGQLLRGGDAEIVRRPTFGGTQQRLVALRDPNLGLFSGAEIAIVDEVLERMKRLNATDASWLSHQESVGWQIVDVQDEIPYHSVFLSPQQPLPSDIKRGQELAAEHGWV